MVLNATFGGENHRPVASHWQTLSHNVVSGTPHMNGFELTMLVVINTDCMGSLNPTIIRSQPRQPFQFLNLCPFSNSQIGFQFSNVWPFLTSWNWHPMTSLTYALTNKLTIDLSIYIYIYTIENLHWILK